MFIEEKVFVFDSQSWQIIYFQKLLDKWNY